MKQSVEFARSDLRRALKDQLLSLMTLPRGSFLAVGLRDAPQVQVQYAGSREEAPLYFDLPAVWLTPLQLPVMHEQLMAQYAIEYVDPDDGELPPCFVRDCQGDLDLAVQIADRVFELVFELEPDARMRGTLEEAALEGMTLQELSV